LIYCDACRTKEGIYHVTQINTFFGPKTTRTKRVQFWLCAECERASQLILCRDELLPRRAAVRFVDNPTFLSPYKTRWRVPLKRKMELTKQNSILPSTPVNK